MEGQGKRFGIIGAIVIAVVSGVAVNVFTDWLKPLTARTRGGVEQRGSRRGETHPRRDESAIKPTKQTSTGCSTAPQSSCSD